MLYRQRVDPVCSFWTIPDKPLDLVDYAWVEYLLMTAFTHPCGNVGDPDVPAVTPPASHVVDGFRIHRAATSANQVVHLLRMRKSASHFSGSGR